MKKYLVISLFVFYCSTGFTQIYGVGNGNGYAVTCIDWDFGQVILPVSLISFDGSCSGDKTTLHWSTASAVNSNYFTIERSADGINFQSLGHNYESISAADKFYFSFTDITAPAGRSFYRLKQTGGNGKAEYSTGLTAGCSPGNRAGVTIYPNPTAGVVNIRTGKPNITLILRNSLGQPLFKMQAKPVQTTINLDQFPQGIYYVEILAAGRSTYHKIVLSRN